MNRKFLVVMAVLVALGGGIYAYLGGFSQPQVTLATSKPLVVAGKYYEGTVTNSKLGDLFQEVSQAVEAGKLQGTLTNIYYNNPQEQGDHIKAFVGVAIADSSVSLPTGFTRRTLPGGKKVLQVSSNAHFLLAPNKMYPVLFDYLKVKGVKVREQYLEQFPENGPALLQVEVRP